MSTGTVKDIEETYRQAGQERWAHTIKVPYHDSQGRIVGVLGIFEEITDRKLAQKALRESEERIRVIFDNSPLGIVHFDSNGVVTDCNQALLEIMGSSREQNIGFNLLTSLKNEGVRKAVESALSGKAGQFEGEYTSVTGHKTSWLNLEYAPFIGTDGLVSGGIGIFQDISERKQAEKALRESESQKQAILDGITTNIAFVNQDLVILWANKTAADSVGKLPSQMIGHKCHSLWADDAKPCDGCPTLKAFKTKKSEHITIVTPIGRVWAEKGEPVFDPEGSLLGVVEIATDITERVRTEQEKQAVQAQLFQSQKLEALGTLVGGIAHDFNNMLQIILGYSELLLIGKKRDDPVYNGLQTIIQTGRGGAELVKKLLALGQQGQIVSVPLDLNHQISRLTTLISRTLPQVWFNLTSI